jgi:leucyl-tRNA synthetase
MSILDASFPPLEQKYLVETSYTYPVSVNGKKRTELNVALDASQQDIEALIKENETILKWLEGKAPEKVIYVKGKMINVVIKK